MNPSLSEFKRLAGQGNLIPCCQEFLADTETPVSAYLKIRDKEFSYLLESAEGGRRWGRYSFIGKYKLVPIKGPLPFQGGLVGYFNYDLVRKWEYLPGISPGLTGMPESLFTLSRRMIIFDHLIHQIQVVAFAHVREDEDLDLEGELIADPKERAEHIMLVDLGRNDVGKGAMPGSVSVPQLMGVERYSHVMHLVSSVQGRLKSEMDQFDLFMAAFPAGTVSGAPKIRAMEIISELEPTPRGPYAGAVGYFGFNGNMDFCITIRTITIADSRLSIQVGAGIVADSSPEGEYDETLRKATAMLKAIERVNER
jgi:anthranilate/para-aminobenzoate synthase component I